MVSKAKFLFDLPFDGSKPKVERSYAPKPPPAKFSTEELEAAKAAAFAEGEQAGHAAACGEHQRNIEQALHAVGGNSPPSPPARNALASPPAPRPRNLLWRSRASWPAG